MQKEKQENTSRKTKMYKLLDIEITVKYAPRAEIDGKWVFGTCHAVGNKKTITISLQDEDGNPLSDEQLEVTLRHELFHAILDTMLYFEDSACEPFVEWLAKATNILHKQGLTI